VNELRQGNRGDGSSLLSMSCCCCRGWRNLAVDQEMQGMEMRRSSSSTRMRMMDKLKQQELTIDAEGRAAMD
jgi:hypothetical protein